MRCLPRPDAQERSELSPVADRIVAVNAAVIVDTNVVVAGFPIDGNVLPVAAILQRMLNREMAFLASMALLAEYR
jgi:hypothetical protein